MSFFKIFKTPPEWKQFESANTHCNNSITQYSNSLKGAFNENFIKMSKSLYPSRIDPFFHLQWQMNNFLNILRQKISTSLSSTGCLKNLKQIQSQFSTYKAEYQLALQKEIQASQEFQQTSKAISTIQNQNELRKAEIENQSALARDKECTKDANKAQLEFEDKSMKYQKKFCEILLSNLEIDANAQIKVAENVSPISSNIMSLSKVKIRFPEVSREQVNIEKLKKKIQKNIEANKKEEQIEKDVKNIE